MLTSLRFWAYPRARCGRDCTWLESGCSHFWLRTQRLLVKAVTALLQLRTHSLPVPQKIPLGLCS